MWTVTITCKNTSEIITYDESVLLESGIEFDDSIGTSDTFAIGSCTAKECKIRVSDSLAHASDYYHAEVIVKKDNYNIGSFICYDSELKNGILTLACYDNMIYANQTVTEKLIGKTFGAVARSACDACGLELASAAFAGADRECTVPTDTSRLTYKDILAYIAQATCNFVRINKMGKVEFTWFHTEMSHAYGGIFDSGTPSYKSGEYIDGGTFQYEIQTSTLDGGAFTDMVNYTSVLDAFSLDVGTDKIVITGVSVKNGDDEYLSGNNDYALAIEDNIFTEQNEKSTAKFIAARCVGMNFWTFTAGIPENLEIQTGDCVYIMDSMMNTYMGYITSVRYVVGGKTEISCEAATPVRQEMRGTSVTTKLLARAERGMDKKIQSYDITARNMTSLISEGFGLYTTSVTDENGAVKQYLHDKPTLEESSVIWIRTAEGLMVSKDGMTSWAIDSNGNALFNVLTAHGVNADWVRIGGLGNGDGQLVVKDASGNNIVLINNAGITMADGTSLINASGVCGDLTFSSGGTPFDLGWVGSTFTTEFTKRELFLQAMIPDKYVITSATLVLSTCATDWVNVADAGTDGTLIYSSCKGYPRSVKAYVGAGQVYKSAAWDGEYTYASSGDFRQIVSGGFKEAGVNGATSITPKQITSGDISSLLSSGLNTIKITVADYSGSTNLSYAQRTGTATALLSVKGYSKN